MQICNPFFLKIESIIFSFFYFNNEVFPKYRKLSSYHGAAETNLTSIHKDRGSILGLAQSDIAVSCGVGHRRGLDLALLWLRHRPAATAPIRPLPWESPYAKGAALKRKKK